MPDLIDEIQTLAAKIEKSRELVSTEEATKNAFVMPFIAALGYDVFDPTEVTPELVADVGTKKGEKIDYAVLRNGEPIMLFECKHHGTNLDNEHASQLFRYFACTTCRVAILTNGIEYRLFSDLENSNKMDSKPFLVFRVTDFPAALIPELKKLTKESFDLDAVLSTASELKYVREIKALLAQQLAQPSDEFVRFCTQGIGVPRLTSAVKGQFGQLTRKAFNDFLSDKLNEKLKTALGAAAPTVPAKQEDPNQEPDREEHVPETTVEELEAFYIVKSIIREVIDLKRVFSRDHSSQFSVIIDDSIRKPIVKFYFNNPKNRRIGFLDENKAEERVTIQDLDELYGHADRLLEAARRYV